MRNGFFSSVTLLWVAIPLQAQVVQLPEMHTFSASSTVSVPDYGGAYLGSVARGAQGNSQRGWGPWNDSRLRGSTVGGGGVSVHATVIDHSTWEEIALSKSRKSKTTMESSLPEESSVKKSSATSGISSIASIRDELAAADAEQERAAEAVYQKALTAEANKEWWLARTYYRLALQKSPRIIKEKAIARLQSLPEK
jgi:hypothetical protein